MRQRASETERQIDRETERDRERKRDIEAKRHRDRADNKNPEQSGYSPTSII